MSEDPNEYAEAAEKEPSETPTRREKEEQKKREERREKDRHPIPDQGFKKEAERMRRIGERRPN